MNRTLNRKEKEMRATVARKITYGELLTEADFVIAWEAGFYPQCSFNDREEFYKTLKASHYKSPALQGYMCRKHPLGTIRKATKEQSGLLCGFGIHADRVQMEYLTPENMEYLGSELMQSVPVIKKL